MIPNEEWEWDRAYDEINQMEAELVDEGFLVIKYLLMISKDEQAQRFKNRMENKPYKITDEDWRNRDKWDAYIESMNEMVEKTSTKDVPWHIISSEDKRHARVEVLKIFIDSVEKHLNK